MAEIISASAIPRPTQKRALDTATAVFSLSHDPPSALGPGRTRSLGSLLRRTGEGVPVLRSSHNSDAGAWGNTAEGGGEGSLFRQRKQTGCAQRPALPGSLHFLKRSS